MENLIPILLILVFFGISLFVHRKAKPAFRFWLSLGLTIYFLIMFFIDSTHKYAYLLFAVFGLFFAISNGRLLRVFNKSWRA